jgi:hypothetical protein
VRTICSFIFSHFLVWYAASTLKTNNYQYCQYSAYRYMSTHQRRFIFLFNKTFYDILKPRFDMETNQNTVLFLQLLYFISLSWHSVSVRLRKQRKYYIFTCVLFRWNVNSISWNWTVKCFIYLFSLNGLHW